MKNLIVKVTNTHVIATLDELKAVLLDAKSGENKCGGQYVTLSVVKPFKMNVYPTDGSEKVKRDSDFVANESYRVKLHFSEDYERAMAKALGVESYEKGTDSNRETLIPNVLMRYISTNNVCIIHLPCEYIGRTMVGADGQPLSAEQAAYANRYKSPKSKSAPVEYRTISIKYVKSISLNGKKYFLQIAE